MAYKIVKIWLYILGHIERKVALSNHESDARERAALDWAEAVTHISYCGTSDELFATLKEHFNDTEIADLTFAISLMNAFNRMAISMRQ